jgi:glyoxylase-like metal-dependent hydrolase (beta-lactamase superfamily II)
MVKTIRAPNPSPLTLQGTNSYGIGITEWALLDPGPWIPHHLNQLLHFIQEMGPPKWILLSHHHPDHAGMAKILAEQTGSPIAASSRSPIQAEIALKEGDLLSLGSFHLLVIETPGHTNDHLAFFLLEKAFLFSGDLILGEGSSILSEDPNALNQYMESLDKLKKLNPQILYPGHGPKKNAISRIEELIQHRLNRHQEIRNAYEKGLKTPEAIVRTVYGLPETSPLFLYALQNCKAHLQVIGKETFL